MVDSIDHTSDNSSEEESELNIDDTNVHFTKTYKIRLERVVPSPNVYILHSAARFENSKTKLVLCLSDFRVVVYDIDGSLRCNWCCDAHNDVITGAKFSCDSQELFYTASIDGSIKLWDLRTKSKPSLTFTDDTDGEDKLKPITCFDVSCDERFICGGTTLVEADSYLLFWDARKASLLGGYWQMHTDDVTQIRFSSSRSESMLSGSLDGLINVFDIRQPDEENALQCTLNANTAVRKVEWFLDSDQIVGCLTDMETVQFWSVDEGTPVKQFSRTDMGTSVLGKGRDIDYVTDMHSVDGGIALLAGVKSRFHCVLFAENKIQPWATFEGNTQIVRCSCYDSLNDVFITGGEKGIVNVWSC